MTEDIAPKVNQSFLSAGPNLAVYRKMCPYICAFLEGRPFSPFEVEIQMSSTCNLNCQWCIGKEMQSDIKNMRLSNNIRGDKINEIVEGIIDCKIGGLGINAVKFSGFIGEPLMMKRETLSGMRQLKEAGFRVGLFTNGGLMGKDTWQTLANMDYVHVSLDAGPRSFAAVKESTHSRQRSSTFNKIIRNIRGLNKVRRMHKKTQLQINIGYVIVPGNHEEIYKTAKLAKATGADSIRFKCDIGGQHNIKCDNILETTFNQVERAIKDLSEKNKFAVYCIHTRHDIERENYTIWDCSKGCLYQNFLATIGSDGNLYWCDHNTMPGAISLGNVMEAPFKIIWQNKNGNDPSKGIRNTCKGSVCPPFGNSANHILYNLKNMTQKFGASKVSHAVEQMLN